MKHYSTNDWINFVRRTHNSEAAAAMQKHLDEGCEDCAKSAKTWRCMVKFAQQEPKQHPPEASLHLVKGSFALRKIVGFPDKKVKFAELAFDSLRQAQVGVRGTNAVARQLLFRSGSVCVDLHLQPTPGSEAVVMVGQLMDSMKPTHGLGGVAVSLMRQGNAISSKKTNEFGEFDFGLETPKDMHLAFGIDNRTTLVVPVPSAPEEAIPAH